MVATSTSYLRAKPLAWIAAVICIGLLLPALQGCAPSRLKRVRLTGKEIHSADEMVKRARVGDLYAIRTMVWSRVDLNRTDRLGRLAHNEALLNGDFSVFDLLLRGGGNPTLKDSSGRDARQIAKALEDSGKFKNHRLQVVIERISKFFPSPDEVVRLAQSGRSGNSKYKYDPNTPDSQGRLPLNEALLKTQALPGIFFGVAPILPSRTGKIAAPRRSGGNWPPLED